MGGLIKRYATERLDGEHFGDFTVRAGIVKPTLEGKHFCECSNGQADLFSHLLILSALDDDSALA